MERQPFQQVLRLGILLPQLQGKETVPHGYGGVGAEHIRYGVGGKINGGRYGGTNNVLPRPSRLSGVTAYGNGRKALTATHKKRPGHQALISPISTLV